MAHLTKRIVVCCDGTWMNNLGAKGTQPPSNVTRLARVIKRLCHDDKTQVVYYDSGVGSSSSKIDQVMGGAFGMGLDQNIREAYNFVCTNYVDGDDIILIGFSRGAFTVRSVADMIATCGLLTADGLDNFFAIFEDYENISDTKRDLSKYFCPNFTEYPSTKPPKGEWVEGRKKIFVDWLKERNDDKYKVVYTRDVRGDTPENLPIKVKALAVFDTVGTLGIPPAPLFGIAGSSAQWKFSNTQISNKVENAFQALALDEPRYAFRPALWERPPGSTTNLKQVWFPGNHGGVGGGWYDQELSDITLAWMCDQLSSVGVEFNFERLSLTFNKSRDYAGVHPFPFIPPQLPLPSFHYVKQHLTLPSFLLTLFPFLLRPLPWAIPSLYTPPSPPISTLRDKADCSHPSHSKAEGKNWLRPWGLGQLRFPDSFFQCYSGSWVRTPGMTVCVDPDTNKDVKHQPLQDTCERVHSCVRVRLACGGLGWDDKKTWTCQALTDNPTNKAKWELKPGKAGILEGKEAAGKVPAELEMDEYKKEDLYDVKERDNDWRWVFKGEVQGTGNHQEPQAVELPEEPLTGYWERYLLGLTAGKGDKDVWKYAREHSPVVGEDEP